jgi:hypothetical protein
VGGPPTIRSPVDLPFLRTFEVFLDAQVNYYDLANIHVPCLQTVILHESWKIRETRIVIKALLLPGRLNDWLPLFNVPHVQVHYEYTPLPRGASLKNVLQALMLAPSIRKLTLVIEDCINSGVASLNPQFTRIESQLHTFIAPDWVNLFDFINPYSKLAREEGLTLRSRYPLPRLEELEVSLRGSCSSKEQIDLVASLGYNRFIIDIPISFFEALQDRRRWRAEYSNSEELITALGLSSIRSVTISGDFDIRLPNAEEQWMGALKMQGIIFEIGKKTDFWRQLTDEQVGTF